MSAWRSEDDLTNEEIFFLHGNCDGFANDNFQAGDIIIALIEHDDEVECDCLLHCFIQRDGLFVDVRGSTNNFNNVIDDFDHGEFEEYSFNDLDSFKSFIQGLEKESDIMINKFCPECGSKMELFDHDDEDGNFSKWEYQCNCGYREE